MPGAVLGTIEFMKVSCLVQGAL